MNNSIHFFDLDGTLWSTNTKAWIIDKDEPNKPLIVLKPTELSEILNGIYRVDEIYIHYNGKEYYISKKMFERIQKKRKSIEEEDLGLSFIEMINPEMEKKLTIFKENIRHVMEGEAVDIGILSARSNPERDTVILNELKKELENMGLKINKFYYVSDYFLPRTNDSVSRKKADILLEHMVGFHVKGDKFEPRIQDLYRDIHFYDDDLSNINTANDLQVTMDEYLRNTSDEVFERILKNIKEKEPILSTHLITNNSVNRFKTTVVKLTIPKKYPIRIDERKLYRFNDF